MKSLEWIYTDVILIPKQIVSPSDVDDFVVIELVKWAQENADPANKPYHVRGSIEMLRCDKFYADPTDIIARLEIDQSLCVLKEESHMIRSNYIISGDFLIMTATSTLWLNLSYEQS